MRPRLALAVLVLAGLLVAPAARPATKTYSSGPLSRSIAPGAPLDHAIHVRDAGPVANVSVWLRLGHRRVADLTVSLVAPDGEEVVLARSRATPGRDFGSGRGCGGTFTVFDDELGDALARSRPPYAGAHKPDERLAALDGTEARGAWTLRIRSRRGAPAGRLLCWKLEIARNVVETKRAGAGSVAAELSYREQNGRYGDVRLRIARAGTIALDTPLARIRCEVCADATGFALLSTVEPLLVRDLDRNGEPEVLLNLYTGGAHCCSFTLLFHLRGERYAQTLGYWGNYGYRLRDLDRDGAPELVAADNRFAYVFVPYVASVPPTRIWRFDGGRLVDVTRRFPAVIAAEARELLRMYERTRRSEFPEVRGILAAYLADHYLLGRAEAGWRTLERAYRRGDLGRGAVKDGYPAGRSYLRKLRSFLRETGYAR
jgi:subtilisin-like proprotein convertase family protein